MATISFPTCPNCSSRLRGGWPSFGPSRVKCGYCGTIVSTQLEGWSSPPFPTPLRKTGFVFKELVFPTCMGYKEPELRLLLNLVWVLPTCMLPLFPVVRLLKMIAESIQYDKTNEPPTWRWIFHQVKK